MIKDVPSNEGEDYIWNRIDRVEEVEFYFGYLKLLLEMSLEGLGDIIAIVISKDQK